MNIYNCHGLFARVLMEGRLVEVHGFRNLSPWSAGSIDLDPRLGRSSRWRAQWSRTIHLMVARKSRQ